MKNNTKVFQSLIKLGIMKDYNDYEKGITRMSRFIFCPKKQLVIHSIVHDMNNSFTGFQLRFGGSISDTTE